MVGAADRGSAERRGARLSPDLERWRCGDWRAMFGRCLFHVKHPGLPQVSPAGPVIPASSTCLSPPNPAHGYELREYGQMLRRKRARVGKKWRDAGRWRCTPGWCAPPAERALGDVPRALFRGKSRWSRRNSSCGSVDEGDGGSLVVPRAVGRPERSDGRRWAQCERGRALGLVGRWSIGCAVSPGRLG